jgi:hypothetical protein
MKNPILTLALRRLLIVTVIGLGLTLLFNEGFFRLQRESHDRPPQEVVLLIPEGTSQRVAQGEPVPSIPEEMIFVVGDVLVVRNQDTESHQLGPLWVPALSSASLNLDEPMQYVYKCSFQTSSYMGLEVKTPTTLGTRFQGLFLAAPATIIFLFLYSLLLYPLQPAAPKAVGGDSSSEYVRQKKASESNLDKGEK